MIGLINMTEIAYKKPITAKKLNSLWLIALFFLLLSIGLISAWFAIVQHSSDQLRDQHLPNVYQTNDQLIISNQLLVAFNSLNRHSPSPQIVEQHQTWLTVAEPAMKSLVKSGQKFPKLSALVNYEKATLIRLSDSAKRNIKLTQLAIERTDVALTMLASQTPQPNMALNSALLLLKASLQDTVEQPFPATQSSIKAQVEQLSQWLFLQTENQTSSSDELLTNAVKLVVGIFTTEHALFGKWQGQQRLYSLFQQQIDAAIVELNRYQAQLSKQAALTMKNINASNSVTAAVAGYSVSIPLKPELAVWLMAAALLFFVIASLLLYRLHRRHHARLDQLVSFTTTVLADNDGTYLQRAIEESKHNAVTERQQEVAKAITARLNNTYSAQFVESLTTAQQKQWRQLAQCTATWQWSFESGLISLSEHIDSAALFASEIIPERSLSKFALRRLVGQQNFHALASSVRKIESQEANEQNQLNSIENVLLTFGEELFVDVAICKENGKWSGTCTDCSLVYREINQLKAQISVQNESLEQQRSSTLQGSHSDYQVLSKMLIQGLLQSQNSMLSETHGHPLSSHLPPHQTSHQLPHLPSYDKAINRALKRLNELQIMAQLATEQRVRVPQDINISQLNAAINGNLARENAARKNTVVICQSANVWHKVHLDTGLYSRLIEGFCHLMLAGLHKQELLITLSVADQAKGQQTWQLSFSLLDFAGNSTEHANFDQSPIAELMEDLDSQNSHDTAYCQKLLRALHGRLVAINQGQMQSATPDHTKSSSNTTKADKPALELVLSFPVAIIENATKHQVDTSLSHTQVLVLTSSFAQGERITQYLTSAKAECRLVDNIDTLKAQCSESAIKQKAIDAVVVGGDFAVHHHVIQNSLALLPDKRRPTLTMIHKQQDDLAKIGLFSLADAWLTRDSLVHAISKGLKQKQSSNQLVTSTTLSQHQFIHTSVELLLAVKQVDQHHALLSLLHWLGFQVTVVVDETSMLNQWRLGRFLVLINEFSASPVIELLAGKGISRGIFSIKGELSDQDETNMPKGTHQNEGEAPQHVSAWQVNTVPAVFELKAWIQRLSPWLVSRKVGASQQLSFSALASTSQFNDLLPAAFDIDVYAKNQGSAELAAFMLDDYVNELIGHARMLTEQLKYADEQAILGTLKEVGVIANIMSAQGLSQLSLQFEHTLKNNAIASASGIISVNTKRLLEQMKQEILLIKQNAEAI
ncbi:hypothetical protein DXX94_12690 [Thalassotalea euphylliae]|uniref:Uncharacterized protein n=2 Tax=Thalassotalea euphylliae TaxID=1655234 RepID=A0A3E0U4M2_9GAMM|nr:hypothetical protein DXX94_12690 [Thalassotalea euphylliae]